MSEPVVSQGTLPPVVKWLWVPIPAAAAFRLFAEEIGCWWPLLTHSVFGEEAKACILDPHAGGRFYEVHTDGQQQSEWGRVLAWEPPHLFGPLPASLTRQSSRPGMRGPFCSSA